MLLPARASMPLVASIVLGSALLGQDPAPLVMTGDLIPGIGTVAHTMEVKVNDSGSWLVRVATDHPDPLRSEVLIQDGVVVLRGGDPIGPGAAQVLRAEDFDLNAAGHHASVMELENTLGDFDDTGVSFDTQLVLQEGGITSLTEFTPGTTYVRFNSVRINAANQLLVEGAVDDPMVTGTSDHVLLLFSLDDSGAIIDGRKLVMEGEILPPLTYPVTTLEMGQCAIALNALGDVLFQLDTSAPVLADAAIFLNDDLLALEGTPSPVSGRLWSNLRYTELALNDNRDWIFTGYLDGATNSNFLIVRNGIKFRQEGDTILAIAPYQLRFHERPLLPRQQRRGAVVGTMERSRFPGQPGALRRRDPPRSGWGDDRRGFADRIRLLQSA